MWDDLVAAWDIDKVGQNYVAVYRLFAAGWSPRQVNHDDFSLLGQHKVVMIGSCPQ
jgi:hypothetical protein